MGIAIALLENNKKKENKYLDGYNLATGERGRREAKEMFLNSYY